MTWNIVVTEINCPYYYPKFNHCNCGHLDNGEKQCFEINCPLKAETFIPACFGEVYETLPIADCEECPVYNDCETKSLI